MTGAAEEPGFERGGAQQGAGDAGEDQRDAGGAELAAMEAWVIAEAAAANGVGEEGAVVDQPADQAEQTADAAGIGGWGGGRVGHRRKMA